MTMAFSTVFWLRTKLEKVRVRTIVFSGPQYLFDAWTPARDRSAMPSTPGAGNSKKNPSPVLEEGSLGLNQLCFLTMTRQFLLMLKGYRCKFRKALYEIRASLRKRSQGSSVSIKFGEGSPRP